MALATATRIQQSTLRAALATVGRAVPTRPSMQILGSVHVEGTGGQLRVRSTDLDMQITAVLPADCELEPCCVAFVPLDAWVSALPEGNVEIEMAKGKIDLRLDRFKANLRTSAADNFPPEVGLTAASTFEVDAAVLRDGIERVAFAAAPSVDRPVLNGVYLEVGEGQLKMAAADGFRLAAFEVNHDGDGQVKAIVPAKAMRELARLIATHDGPVTVATSPTMVSFATERVTLVSRLIEGTFPDYRKIIPPDPVCRIDVDTALLNGALRAALATSNDAKIVHLTATDGTLAIRSTAAETGESDAVIDATIDGERKMAFALDHRWLAAVLAVLGARTHIALVSPERAVLFTSADVPGYRHVLMPMFKAAK